MTLFVSHNQPSFSTSVTSLVTKLPILNTMVLFGSQYVDVSSWTFFGGGGLLLCEATLRCLFITPTTLYHPTYHLCFLNNHCTFSHSGFTLSVKVTFAIILVLVSSNNSNFSWGLIFILGLHGACPGFHPMLTPRFLNNHSSV